MTHRHMVLRVSAAVFACAMYLSATLDAVGAVPIALAILAGSSVLTIALTTMVAVYGLFVLLSFYVAAFTAAAAHAQSALFTGQLLLVGVLAWRGHLIDPRPWVMADGESPNGFARILRPCLLTAAVLLFVAASYPDAPILKMLCWGVTSVLFARALPRQKKAATSWRAVERPVAGLRYWRRGGSPAS